MDCWSFGEIVHRLGTLWDTSEINNIGGCGEITAVPFFEELLDYLDRKPGKTCFATNGYRLQPDSLRQRRLDHVVVSLHSLIPDVYDDLTGTVGHLPIVVDNLRALAKQPRDYGVVIAFVVTGANVHEVPAMARFSLDAGVDEVRFLPLTNPIVAGLGEYADDITYTETTDTRVALDTANAMLRKGGNTSIYSPLSDDKRHTTVASHMHCCKSPTRQILIGPDGHVQPCCFIPQDHALGNIFDDPWETIWNSAPYEEFREQVRTNTSALCLKYCKNWG